MFTAGTFGIRLVNSDGTVVTLGTATSVRGRVEVLYSGIWGTVCNAYFGSNEAAVACKQLGLR